MTSRWQCTRCRTWVREEPSKACAECREAERRLTPMERLQLSADAGVDTWEERRCEK